MEIFNIFDNIYGGESFTMDGNQYDTHDNIFGGEDLYENNELIGYSQDNIFGGEDIFEGGEKVASTREGIFGGLDLFDGNGMYEGTIEEGPMGTTFDGFGESFSTIDNGNVTTILGYSNPLAHAGEYIMPTLIL